MKKYLWLFLVLFACAGIGLGSYSLAAERIRGEMQAERDLNILLNRSELEWFPPDQGPIYVFGHKSPDPDTVCSSIVYADLLKQLGYDARPAVLGRINSETAYILRSAGVEVPELLEDASGKNVILMDHSDYLQSADGLRDANIIGIIDHHGAGSVVTGGQVIYDARPVGGTAAIVWMRARNYGLEIDPPMAALLAGAILSDTGNLKSSGTTFADRTAYQELSKTAGIKDSEAFFQEIYKASISYEGMPDFEILSSDVRDYESGGRTFTIGCISAYDEARAAELAERMKILLPEFAEERGAEMSFAQISVLRDDLSISYIVPSDETAEEVMRAAFPDRGEFDGISFVFKPGFSRKTVLVSAISDVLAAHPSE